MIQKLVVLTLSIGWITTPLAQAGEISDTTLSIQETLALDRQAMAKIKDEILVDSVSELFAWQAGKIESDPSPSRTELLHGFKQGKKIILHVLNHEETSRRYRTLAAILYSIGELTLQSEIVKDQRITMYEEMVEAAKKCIDLQSKPDGTCWLLLGVAYGRLGTTRGVISSAFLAKDVERSLEKARDLGSPDLGIYGDKISNDAKYALGVFYRIVPDSWIVKIIARTRGDKQKAVDSFREIAPQQPYRLELQKELAVALICQGDDIDDPAMLAEGRAILQKVVAGAYDAQDRRPTDAIDKDHAGQLLKRKPKESCGYSRDGFQDVSDDAVDKAQ